MSFQILPDPMHNHQCIASGLIMELLQEFIKNVVVGCHTFVGIG